MRVELHFENLRHQPKGYLPRLRDHLAKQPVLLEPKAFWDQVHERTVVEFDLVSSPNPRSPRSTLRGITAVAEALADTLEDMLGHPPSFGFQAESQSVPLTEQDLLGSDLASVQLNITLDNV